MTAHRPSRVARAARAAIVALASLLLLAGCMGVPTTGEVVSVGSGGAATDRTPGIAIDPRPPRKGMGPSEIVDGFLEAMLATPLQTRTAQQFLTSDAQADWHPGDEILVYSGKEAAAAETDESVDVQLGPTWRIDDRGVWRGAVTTAEQTLSFDVVKDGDQWRIAHAPDALIVPDWWFEGRYSQMALYYFNADQSLLVPEPVFVPRGNELATVLIRDLLHGPGEDLAGIVHSVIPSDVGQGLSVPVDANGVADIALTGSSSQQKLSADEIGLLSAQLAWTLRQDPDITKVRLSIGGQPVTQPNGKTEFNVADTGPQFDPSGYQSSPLFFALREGKVVAGTLPSLNTTRGPLGRRAHAVRSIGVDLRGSQVAAVSSDGHSLLLGSMTDIEGVTSTAISGAQDLLKPSWDGLGRIWVVDSRRGGAAVSVVAGGQVSPIQVPGISGADVRRLLVSRDGTRLLAVVRTPMGDRVLVSRITTAADGTPSALEKARVISSDLGTIDDLAWSSSTSVVALHTQESSARVTTLPIDGAGAALLPGGTLVGQPLTALIGSPATGQPSYGVHGTDLISLSTVGRDERVPDALHALTYAG
ncbi:LpqB family beta-propeller domain-containing protein [Nocardioides sp. Kera G14]|uniref:LpqB family beta-propeller domain-containing protein n=1 Tax=Nocardioides sp. Kera G14 TaxID=2884264 RepID=UPI001D11D99C|nr:LpqB family beta-propeller domain-containing protein [Nocardioides sp. Kera G14]UDY22735.1 LpqB family beta-propeller domain-containing protein [Nocardioides sp. Kera G14]